MQKKLGYNKIEKLKSRKLIQQLFSEGKSFTVFPLKFFFMPAKEPLDFFVKTGVGASSRNFKKAVNRNYIKRLLRETYRTHKLPLHEYLQQRNKQIVLFILYIDKTLPDFITLSAKMPAALQRLMKELDEKSA